MWTDSTWPKQIKAVLPHSGTATGQPCFGRVVSGPSASSHRRLAEPHASAPVCLHAFRHACRHAQLQSAAFHARRHAAFHAHRPAYIARSGTRVMTARESGSTRSPTHPVPGTAGRTGPSGPVQPPVPSVRAVQFGGESGPLPFAARRPGRRPLRRPDGADHRGSPAKTVMASSRAVLQVRA